MKRLSVIVWMLALVPAVCPAGASDNAADPKDGYELVDVPGGEFLMGSPDGEGPAHEHPRHKVSLDAYSIGKHEVTVGRFRRYCRDAGKAMPDQMGHGDNDPVMNVTWTDAAAYCEWAGLRLPTEAEWEKAARGGSGTTYPWGDVASHNMANYTGKSGRDAWDDVSPVGSFPPNRYGAYDMAGNVWEWCGDRYGADYYGKSPPGNPRGPDTGESRVLRGGSWDSPSDYIRPAYRAFDAPDYSSSLLGFRCARSK